MSWAGNAMNGSKPAEPLSANVYLFAAHVIALCGSKHCRSEDRGDVKLECRDRLAHP